jgi:hypothetical protein
MMGDLTAVNLRMLHTMRGFAADDAGRAEIDAVADQARAVLAASVASQAREAAIRELQPVTRVPAAPYGAIEDVANIRMNNIPIFTGSASDTIEVVQWISRILNLAQSRNLSFNATINLMIQGSGKGAANYIDEMKQENKTLSQIVQQLEMRFGSLTTVNDARVKCNNMPRLESESLSTFIDRLRIMAKMACRQEPNDVLRLRAVDALVESNIRRVLPTSVRTALEERLMNRSLMGLPTLTARDIEKECLDLEAKRKERKNELKNMAQGKRNVHHVHQAQVLQAQVELDDDTSDTDDDVTEDDDPQEFLIQAINQHGQKFVQRGRPINGQKVMHRAFKNYNERFYQGNQRNRPQMVVRQAGNFHAVPYGGAAPAGQAVPQPGPPNKVDNKFKPINELLSLANCSKGQCIQCGNDGHIMRNLACVLKDKPLVDKACAKCGKGLHSADDCPRVFQQHYISPAAEAGNAAAVQESLND